MRKTRIFPTKKEETAFRQFFAPPAVSRDPGSFG
jgi:hypothetical protein